MHVPTHKYIYMCTHKHVTLTVCVCKHLSNCSSMPGSILAQTKDFMSVINKHKICPMFENLRLHNIMSTKNCLSFQSQNHQNCVTIGPRLHMHRGKKKSLSDSPPVILAHTSCPISVNGQHQCFMRPIIPSCNNPSKHAYKNNNGK